jgi:hypothetical protein
LVAVFGAFQAIEVINDDNKAFFALGLEGFVYCVSVANHYRMQG